jgi:hypothetical protein
MAEEVVFYKLSHKYVNTREDTPPESKQIIYYSLAVGHYLGVVDCLSGLVRIPLSDFDQFVNRLPEGVGRHKLQGVRKWGEIEINASHAPELLAALQAGMPQMLPQEAQWAEVLVETLQAVQREPVLYLIARSSS